MRLIEKIRRNASDIVTFGPRFALRHLGHLKRDRMVTIPIRGVGPVHFRAGDSDAEAIRQIFGKREYDMSWPPEMAARIRSRYEEILLSKRKPIIVDAGANIGMTSLWFGYLYPEAAIVAVEPDPGNLAVLRENISHRPNHVILEAAIGAQPGHAATEHPVPNFGMAVRTSRAEAGVPIVTVDDAFAASGGDEPFIVKIDIEGFEADLFASNLGWLERAFVVTFEPHDWMLPGKLTSRTFQQAIAQHPFEMYISGQNIFYVRV